MKSLICFGEALIDLLQDPQQASVYHANAGGAPANVAVGFAKLGGNALFVGTLGQDKFSDLLHDEFTRYGVNTQSVVRTNAAFTAVAVVSLAANGERSFGFYRGPSADLLFSAADFNAADFAPSPLFHICSNTLTHPPIRAATHAGVALARAHGCIISFDVNIRASLWPDAAEIVPEILGLMPCAHILKCSVEEWQLLCAADGEARVLAACFADTTQLILITDGDKPLRSIQKDVDELIAVKAVPVIDSTAAGDGFMAGFLFALAQQNTTTDTLKSTIANDVWRHAALQFAAQCGAFACSKYGAFISLATAADVKLPAVLATPAQTNS
jgi:fructokinase